MNIAHFCIANEYLVAQSDWLYWASLPQNTEAQQTTSKAWLLAESIATGSQWCEAVLYCFLLGGEFGFETAVNINFDVRNDKSTKKMGFSYSIQTFNVHMHHEYFVLIAHSQD